MAFRVYAATPEDGPEILVLLPRVGAFPRPEHRAHEPIHLPDARVIARWIDGGEPSYRIFVARNESDALWGLALVRMQPDALSGEPSAHLETLAVADGAEGQGVGSALIARAEQSARKEGARSMSLHVFETNERARALYSRKGYVTEWIRYIKVLHEDER